MAKGVEVQLFDALGVAIANATNIQIAWFDLPNVSDLKRVQATHVGITTDASGWLRLDLSNITGLALSDWGFLVAYQPNAGDHKQSLVFSSRMQIVDVTGGTDVYASQVAAAWVKPAVWTALPSVIGVQKFVGLHAVYPDSNFVALSATGAYTVDWGDGSAAVNVATGVTAERNITWASAPAASDVGIAGALPVTFTDAGDVVNRTAHGWQNGRQVAFSVITSTTGISVYTTYFVVGMTANTFQVSATVGGAALVLTTNGSGSVYVPEYRQVVISVVPNGGNITALNLHIKHSTAGLQAYSTGWLDIAMSLEFMTDLRFAAQTPGAGTSVINHHACQRFSVIASDLRQLGSLFNTCYILQSVPSLVTSTTAAASLAVTFTDAGDVVNATAHGFRNGDACVFTQITTTTGIVIRTTYFVIGAAANTFQVSSTYGGVAVLLTTNGSGSAQRGTNFNSMFNACYALKSVPLFNTAAGTNFNSMFASCSLLQSAPLFNTAAGTDFTGMFNTCYALKSVPLFNTAAGTDFGSMFASCSSLQSVPLFNTAAGLTVNGMFSSCFSLQSVPLFNTAACTNFNGMFASCSSLQSVPLFNTAAGTDFGSMFSNCFSLQSVPLFNTAAGLTAFNMFSSCFSLQSVPLFNTAACTNFNGMFNTCYALKSVPLFNTAAGTNFGGMFSNCFSLQSVPLFNTAAAAFVSSMFSSCRSLKQARLAGTPITISYANCMLSAAALDGIYAGLKSGVTAQTITVTGNWGVATDTPSIATGKGWTVTG